MVRSCLVISYPPGRELPFIPDVFEPYSVRVVDYSAFIYKIYRDMTLSFALSPDISTDEKRLEALKKMKMVQDALKKTFGPDALARYAFMQVYNSQDYDIGVIHGPVSAQDIESIRSLASKGAMRVGVWHVVSSQDIPSASSQQDSAKHISPVYKRTPRGYTNDIIVSFDQVFEGYSSYSSPDLISDIRQAFSEFLESGIRGFGKPSIFYPDQEEQESFRVRKI